MFDAADFAQHEMDRGRDEQDRLTYERERAVPEGDEDYDPAYAEREAARDWMDSQGFSWGDYEA